MTGAQPPGGGQDRKDKPWEYALDSDAQMTSVAVTETLSGYCWAGGLGWRRYDEATGAWPAVPEEDTVDRVRQWMLAMRAYCMKQAADKLTQGQNSSADYWSGLAEGWRKAASTGKITGVTKLARGACYVNPAEFDTHPDLMNAPNWVIDLRTGARLEHSPAPRFTQVAGCDYVPGARHPDIDKALGAIPADIRGYAQLRYGQAITGYKPPDDVIDVQHGQGENGKTTILAAMKNALGDYAEVLPVKLLYLTPGAHSTDLMTLRGCRLGIVEELEEEGHLSVAALKIATAERITARLVHKDNVSFANICSLVICANYRLQIRETDHGTWRRLEGSLPYPYTFRKPHEHLRDENDRRGDPTLRERVKTDKGERAQAMLAWLVAGAMAWYAGEMAAGGRGWVREPMTMGQPPERVRASVAEWRESCDLIYGFLAEPKAVFERGAHVIGDELLAAFNEWITGRGHRAWGAELFAARWEAHAAVRDAGVVKARLRSGQEDGLSRPPGGLRNEVPARYRGWLGVRFADDVSAGGSRWSGVKVNPYREGLARGFTNTPDHPGQRSSSVDWQKLSDMADPGA
jgi:phage/plasmid-associated DNA primase